VSVPSSLLLGCDDTLDWLEKNRSESEKKEKKNDEKNAQKKRMWERKKNLRKK